MYGQPVRKRTLDRPVELFQSIWRNTSCLPIKANYTCIFEHQNDLINFDNARQIVNIKNYIAILVRFRAHIQRVEQTSPEEHASARTETVIPSNTRVTNFGREDK